MTPHVLTPCGPGRPCRPPQIFSKPSSSTRGEKPSVSTYSLISRWLVPSHADHHVRCLDDGPSLVPGLESEIGDGLIGDRCGDDRAVADVDQHMGGRGALLDVDDLAL